MKLVGRKFCSAAIKLFTYIQLVIFVEGWVGMFDYQQH